MFVFAKGGAKVQRKWVARVAVAAALAALTSPSHAAGDPLKGATLFRGRCAVCHSVDPAKPNAVAPTLAGIIGRRAGSLPERNYTAAIKTSKIVFTPAVLDTFLTNPQATVKGTTMPISLPDPAQRADVIAYLATLKGAPKK